jgi:hypothetical protein
VGVSLVLAGLLVDVTVAERLTVAPAVTGFGVTVRTMVVGSTPGVVMVLGELEPPQPKRKRRLAKAKIGGTTRIDESSNRYIFRLEQYMIVIVIVN